jgi:pimeloyl-ACP methyl ester carboxylesterase
MLTAMLYPELASKLIVWHIVGGVYSTMNLGALYILPTIMTLRSGQGIEGVLQMGEWKALIDANPKNRQRILDIGADEFQRVMMRWLTPWVPKPGMTIPGVDDWMFDRIQIPTLIVRGGENDVDHPKRTSLEVSCLIKGSKLIEPPWPEDAWERAMEATLAGTGDLFGPWVKAAPAILDFVRE